MKGELFQKNELHAIKHWLITLLIHCPYCVCIFPCSAVTKVTTRLQFPAYVWRWFFLMQICLYLSLRRIRSRIGLNSALIVVTLWCRFVSASCCEFVLIPWLTLWLKARVQHIYISFWHFDRHRATSIPLCPSCSATVLHFSLLLDKRKWPSRHRDRENEMYGKTAAPKSYVSKHRASQRGAHQMVEKTASPQGPFRRSSGAFNFITWFSLADGLFQSSKVLRNSENVKFIMQWQRGKLNVLKNRV